jgi:hypothetical protein
VRGIGALLATRPHQARRGQPGQQRVQHHELQPGIGDPAPELGQDRVVKARVSQGQPEQVLPVDPGPHRIGRPPARCSTVTSASRDGDQPGLPRIPNAAANCSSASHWPSRSRISTVSGRSVFLAPYIAAIAAAICGSGSGHGTGCMHTTYPIPRPG